MKQRAVTITELLTVIAIIMIVTAIATPIARSVRAKADEATCSSNLRQIWTSVSLYRQEYDGVDFPAPPPAMGFPPDHIPYGMPSQAAQSIECQGDDYSGHGQATYMKTYISPGFPHYEHYTEHVWIPMIERDGDNALLFADANHQTTAYSEWARMKVSYVTLGGQFKSRSIIGNPYYLPNWFRQP